MYLKHFKLLKKGKEKLLEYFEAKVPVGAVAKLIDIHQNFAIRLFYKLRERIALIMLLTFLN